MNKRVCKDEQIKLIMECRQSGLSDYQWCEQNGIHPGTFYNWVSKPGIISVFVCNGTVGNLFITAIADIRSLIESVTVFPLKVGTSLVAGRARSTLDTAKNDFPTSIGFLQW